MAASFLVSAAGIAGVSAWMVMKNRQVDVFRPAIKVGAWTILVSAVLVSVSGDMDSKIMIEQQPMKMAAAEGLYETTEGGSPFSILTIGDVSGDSATPILEIPGLLSFLSYGNFDQPVAGINDLQQQYLEQYPQYGPEMNYVPYVPITYWGFRLMIGLGMIAALYALWVLWAFRGGRTPRGKFYSYISASIVLFPLLGISAGWIFTEMGRQPWIVFGEQVTAEAVSPLVTAGEVWISMIGFTLLYAVLAVIEVTLLLKQIKKGAPEVVVEDPYADAKKDDDKQLYFAY
jgi:cytochrome d ubiquinol oxidase subunit I